MNKETPRRALRVLIAKPGLDGHDRGVKALMRGLRDAGIEVIYTGLRATPESVALAALQEDVDAVGVSNLSGAHLTLFPQIAAALRSEGVDLDRVVLFGGGTIPPEDDAELVAAGYRAIFRPGSRVSAIARFLQSETADDE